MNEPLAATFFVNRDMELLLIEDAFETLVEEGRLLRTPIVEFYGVGGIGKTMMLEKIEERCNEKQLHYLWANADQDVSDFSQAITAQAEQKYHVQPAHKERTWRVQSVEVAKELLKQGPVVLFIDRLDAASESLLHLIEGILSDLSGDKNFFVVMASKRLLTFDRERSVSRKLTPFQLKPLDQESCEKYFGKFGEEIRPEQQSLIMRWTQGYPVAMSVIIQGMREHQLDIHKPEDQKHLLAYVIDEVINNHVFAQVEPHELSLFQMILPLLSVSRRFNLVLMQELIEQFAGKPFAHGFALTSSLAYLSLPKRIIQATGALNWNAARSGMSVDASIRHILLLHMGIEHPQRLRDIHTFLAERNKEFASIVSGPDHVRYLQEYLYHIAQIEDNAHLASIIEQNVTEIIGESFQSLLQFSEEFSRDEELREALGTHVNIALSLIHKRWAQIYRQSALETEGFDRIRNLREFFYYTLHDPEVEDLPALLRQNLDRVIQSELPDVSQRLLDELARDEKFRDALGDELDTLRARIRDL